MDRNQINVLCEHCRRIGLNMNGWCYMCRKYTNNWQEKYKNQLNIRVGTQEYYKFMDNLCPGCMVFTIDHDNSTYCDQCQCQSQCIIKHK